LTAHGEELILAGVTPVVSVSSLLLGLLLEDPAGVLYDVIR